MFRIVVVTYNAETYIDKCLQSIQTQDHKVFRCIIIDDVTTDRTNDRARAVVGEDHRFVIHRNEVRAGALLNIRQAINMMEPDDEDVIVTVDGDDWLEHTRALSRIREAYDDPKIRLTFGTLRCVSNNGLFCAPYPEDVIRERRYREYQWNASHPRTFKYELWRKIRPEDFVDPATGKHWWMTWDQAMMFPMLEMCEPGEFCHIPEVLYAYNDVNPLNDNRVDAQLQRDCEARIRAMPRYEHAPRGS
jgi:glycosyltransferase involved in cell wall biosynthesis